MDHRRDSSQIRWALSYLRPYRRRVAVLGRFATRRTAVRELLLDPACQEHAREDFEVARFSDVARDNMNAWIRVGRQSTVFSIVVGSLTIIGSSLVLLFGGLAVLRGTLTAGTLLLVLAYLGFIYGPLSAIANTANELQQAFAGARRVRAAFALTPEPIAVPGAKRAVRVRGEVAFDRVTFAYEPGRPVLRDITFSAIPGETIALVGPSGGGKSTLVTLMARFYEHSAGAIRIDGVDIREYELKSLRQSIALVLQDAIITSGTVLDNLRYGRPDASDEDIRRAARAANADEFIAKMPHGYRSNLGEAGAGLSGGQKQRLSIARAFLKDAPILILDEPTAALDTLSERLMIDALKRLRNGRTTFVIAHRLSTVLEADRIIVLDKGRIIGEGTHDELLGNCDLYNTMASQLVAPSPRSEAGSPMFN